MPPTRVAFFTGGTTGAGHLMRGIAIERALVRAGVAAQYAMFGARSPLAVARRPNYHVVTIDPVELLDPQRAPRSDLARALAGYAPDVLIVDLFWAPLRLLLPVAGCEAWLLLRRVPGPWFVGPPGHPYERSRFARVIAIEPGMPPGQVDETVEPVVVCNPDECRPAGSLRAALGVAPGEQLTVVQQAGVAGEWSALLERCAHRPVHVFTPSRDDAKEIVPPEGARLHDGDPFFPLAEWIADADAIVSGAGYNAYWEARWLGYGARTTFVPFPRKIDDQAWRVRSCASHAPRENGADAIARRLA